VKTPEQGLNEKRFLDLARKASTTLFEKNGEAAPAEAVFATVIDEDGKLWKAMQPQLAEYGAIALIKAAVLKKAVYEIDSAQLDLFPTLPRRITFKKKKIDLLNADAAALDWYGDWWQNRLVGTANRAAQDTAYSSEIQRAKRILKKYDPTGTVESALLKRAARLAKVRRAREQSKKRRKPGTN
jgi:hypothetical protein